MATYKCTCWRETALWHFALTGCSLYMGYNVGTLSRLKRGSTFCPSVVSRCLSTGTLFILLVSAYLDNYLSALPMGVVLHTGHLGLMGDN